jgi:phenylacetate-coenzyme A ligase PaaK-like adenylate-forming protein
MKPLIELSIEHYEALLKHANQKSPLYFRLKNAVKPQPDTIAVLCDLDELEFL